MIHAETCYWTNLPSFSFYHNAICMSCKTAVSNSAVAKDLSFLRLLSAGEYLPTFRRIVLPSTSAEHVWNVMAHAQKPDLVFQRNGRVHLNWPSGQFSRLLAAEVWASAVVMVVMPHTSCSGVVCKTTGYPLHSHVSPSLPLRCVTVCHQVSTELYQIHNTACTWRRSQNKPSKSRKL